MKPLIRYRCPDCGGHDIRFTGTLSWGAGTQQYHVRDVDDDSGATWCSDCVNLDDRGGVSIMDCTPIKEVSDDGGETWRDL